MQICQLDLWPIFFFSKFNLKLALPCSERPTFTPSYLRGVSPNGLHMLLACALSLSLSHTHIL